jgi:hypothetical protein
VEVSAVSRRGLWKWIGLGLILVMSGAPARAKAAPQNPVVVTISVYNEAAVLWRTVRAAEEEASLVLREAGIDVEWVNCQRASEETSDTEKSKSCGEVVYPEHLALRIVKRSVGLSPNVMGISFLSEDGSGCQADLFYERMEGLRQKSEASMASILGHVASHEIGHLLLGTNSHAPHGIMRGVWGKEELISLTQRALVFSEKESARMRERLGSAEAHRKEQLRASGAQPTMQNTSPAGVPKTPRDRHL